MKKVIIIYIVAVSLIISCQTAIQIGGDIVEQVIMFQLLADEDETKKTAVKKCISGDCKNGKGSYIQDKWKYTGQFKNGRKHGSGVLIYKDGKKYSGKWKNGIKHGKFIYYNKDGKLSGEAVYKNGNRVE